MQKNNPLKPAILDVLRNAENAQRRLAIHELLSELKSVSAIPTLHGEPQLALFRLNWMMMNALYQLQLDLLEENLLLNISTLEIFLESIESSQVSAQEKQLQTLALRDYYLNWDNFSDTTVEEVQSILDGLWQDYVSSDQRSNAFEVLGLEGYADAKTIRQAYRKLAKKHHPDKGGDAEQFMRIRSAYEILK